IAVASCVHIIRYHIPSSFDARFESTLVLDCDYSYNANDLKLIVRWFFESIPEPIYQWIPDHNIRRVSDFLLPYFDTDYLSNPSDQYTKYRAVKINNPTPELSGRYMCDVSSLAGQAKKENLVTIFETGDLELECVVDGVNPRGIMTISQQSISESTHFIAIEKNVAQVSFFNENTSLYETRIKYKITEKDMIGIRTSRKGTVLQCQFTIPNTTFVRRKRIALYSSTY
ncbi:hypothetical protein B4U79_13125, partial [Dinothrombium tinctorium]